MRDDTTTGIPASERPGHWLVPPWPAAASFTDVVSHFDRFHPWHVSTATLLAFYEAFQVALESAPTGELTGEFERRWRAGMRECTTRCVQFYRNEIRHGESTASPARVHPIQRSNMCSISANVVV